MYAMGIDIVDTAVAEANKYLKTQKLPEGAAEVKNVNFFDLPEERDSQFDLIYDYTFLCALYPSLRE